MGHKKSRNQKKGSDKLPIMRRSSERSQLEREIEDIVEMEGVVYVAVIDDRGEDLAFFSRLEKVDEGEILAQISLIRGVSRKIGKDFRKGDIDEINITWERGVSILKKIDRNYSLQVITSEIARIERIHTRLKVKHRRIKRELWVYDNINAI